MLDKLTLTSNRRIAPQEVADTIRGLSDHSVHRSNRFYQDIVVAYNDGPTKSGAHLISVSTNPVPPISPLRLDLNPGRFTSFEELVSLVENFDKLEAWHIRRIDHAVDLPVGLGDIHKSLIVSKKRFREVYSDGRSISGIYIGVAPEIVNIYSKTAKNQPDSPLTRIEVRQFGQKCAVTTLLELPELMHLNPFEDLNLYDLRPPETVQANQKEKYQQLHSELVQFGAQGAFKRLNKNWNFKRDFGRKFLVPNISIPKMNSMYLKELEIFFGKEAQDLRVADAC